MDHEFTEKIGRWLQTPEEERDWAEGATMLLQLSGNRVMHRNIMANLTARRGHIAYQLQKYYDFRVRELTRAQVAEMSAKADGIVRRRGLSGERRAEGGKGKSGERRAESGETAVGMRPDHDALPDEIKALWVENLDLLRRMRELHLELRRMTLTDAPCPDSDRYPFVKEIISLDKRMADNYSRYDAWHLQ